MDNVCSICLGTIQESNNTHILECNHKFHTDCIIKWFRSPQSDGRCPLCNENKPSTTELIYSPWYTREYIHERCKTLRNINRRNDAPKKLNNEFTKLKNKEIKLKNLQLDIKNHKKK